MTIQGDLNLTRIDRLRYRQPASTEEFLGIIRKSMISGERFKVARLAIGRSLAHDQPVEMLPDDTEYSTAIEGIHLFGEDASLWACLIAEAHSEKIESADVYKRLVEAHWKRGADLLEQDFKEVGERDVDFAVRLAEMAGATSSGVTPVQVMPTYRVGTLSVKIGEISIDPKTNQQVIAELNAPGSSPHIALMGKTRSGKTRTGLVIAEEIVRQANIPFVLIDPKGEFVKDGRLVAKSEWNGRTLADRFPGLQFVDVATTPVPLDFLALGATPSESEIAHAAIAFRDSFQKCIRAKGDVAMDELRETVSELLHEGGGPVSLERIRDRVKEQSAESKRRKDSIQAKLNELTALRLFEPLMNRASFFSRRWVIGLGNAPEESKRLTMFLILDALAAHLLAQEDSETDARGNRAIRHLLVVDEAAEILAYRHGALSSLIRKCASKGEIVMLLSQSPEDFDQEEDDFLSQMGTISVFKSSAQSVKNLRAALGRPVKPEEFSDKALPDGYVLAKLPDGREVRLVAWQRP